MEWITIFTILSIVLVGFWFWKRRTPKESYWKKMGVYEISREKSANFLHFANTKKHRFVTMCEEYATVPESVPMYGNYIMGSPILNIKDPDLLRQILVKDFDSFVDRQPAFMAKLTDTPTDRVDVLYKQISKDLCLQGCEMAA